MKIAAPAPGALSLKPKARSQRPEPRSPSQNQKACSQKPETRSPNATAFVYEEPTLNPNTAPLESEHRANRIRIPRQSNPHIAPRQIFWISQMPRAFRNSFAFTRSLFQQWSVNGCEPEHRACRIRTPREMNPNTAPIRIFRISKMPRAFRNSLFLYEVR